MLIPNTVRGYINPATRPQIKQNPAQAPTKKQTAHTPAIKDSANSAYPAANTAASLSNVFDYLDQQNGTPDQISKGMVSTAILAPVSTALSPLDIVSTTVEKVQELAKKNDSVDGVSH